MIDIPEIKQQTDIVAVISEVVDLEQRGSRYVGCCPLHDEKTGSFTVFADDQRFRCFGCGESGDVLDFLQKYHDIPLAEAIRILKPDFKATRRPRIDTPATKHKKLIQYIDIWKALYFDHLSEPRRQAILDYCIDNWQPWHRPEYFRLMFFHRWRRRIVKYPALVKEWKKNVTEYRRQKNVYQRFKSIKTEDNLVNFVVDILCIELQSRQHG